MTIGSELIRLAREADLEAIKAYLSAHEWKVEAPPQGNFLRIEAPAASGDGVFAVVPSSREFEDFPIRVSELALLVGAIENRPGEDVLRDMAVAIRADTPPKQRESPFHMRGYIGPQHAAAWKAMKWHEDIIQSALRDFEHNPPEYVLVRAPALSGKTTFAMQFIDRLAQIRPDFLTVYLPVGGANSSLATFLLGVRDALAERLKEWSTLAVMTEEEFSELASAIDSWGTLHPNNLVDLLRTLLLDVPEYFRRVILVIDDVEYLPPGQRELIAEDLRSIHAARCFGPLSRFSVLVLARSLVRYPHVVSPLGNVVEEYQLSDFTLEDVQAFLDRSGSMLGGLRFDPAAVRYVFQKVGGQAIAIQRLCWAAARTKTHGGNVEMADIFEGICECFEKGGGFVERILDLEQLSPEARTVLDQMLRDDSVLPLTFDPAVAQLIDSGIAKVGAHNRCVCRSPLVCELLVKRYYIPQVSPNLASSESRLLALPQVSPLLCNNPLFDTLFKLHPSGHATGFAPSEETERDAMRVIQERFSEIDLPGIQYWIRKYYGDVEEQPNSEDILRAVAKAYLHWCKQAK